MWCPLEAVKIVEEAELDQQGVLYSTRCKYAIRAAICLTRHAGGAVSSQIAHQCGLAPWSLAKILKCLAQKGILSSSSGPHGGFVLRRDPADIRLLDIAEALDPESCSRECAMGYSQCSPGDRCAMHDSWQEVRTCIQAYLRETTIAELARTPKRVALKRARVRRKEGTTA